jgi:hypothetical protein
MEYTRYGFLQNENPVPGQPHNHAPSDTSIKYSNAMKDLANQHPRQFGYQSRSWINITTKTKQSNQKKTPKQIKQNKTVKNKNKTKIIKKYIVFKYFIIHNKVLLLSIHDFFSVTHIDKVYSRRFGNLLKSDEKQRPPCWPVNEKKNTRKKGHRIKSHNTSRKKSHNIFFSHLLYPGNKVSVYNECSVIFFSCVFFFVYRSTGWSLFFVWFQQITESPWINFINVFCIWMGDIRKK